MKAGGLNRTEIATARFVVVCPRSPHWALCFAQEYVPRSRDRGYQSYEADDNSDYEVVEPNEPEPMDPADYTTPTPVTRNVRQRANRQY